MESWETLEPGVCRLGLWRSLVSALDWGSRGREFESPQPDHSEQHFCSMMVRPIVVVPGTKSFTWHVVRAMWLVLLAVPFVAAGKVLELTGKGSIRLSGYTLSMTGLALLMVNSTLVLVRIYRHRPDQALK
jgi:hypothetical protein